MRKGMIVRMKQVQQPGLFVIFAALFGALCSMGCSATPAPISPAGSTDDGLHGSGNQKGKARVKVDVNTAPKVSKVVTREGRIRPGETVAFRVNASDSDGDTLRYAWRDDCQGTFHSTVAKKIFWTAPQPGPLTKECVLEVEVFDGRGGRNWGKLRVYIDGPVMPNLAPRLLSSFQSAKTIGRNKQAVFRVQAVDPEGLPLVFTWHHSGGTLSAPVTNAGQSEVTWTPPATGCHFIIQVTVREPTGLIIGHRFRIKVRCP